MVGAVRDPGRFLDWADVVLLVRKNKIGEVLGIVLKAATPKTNHMQPFLDNALFYGEFLLQLLWQPLKNYNSIKELDPY